MPLICPACETLNSGFDAHCPECGEALPLDSEITPSQSEETVAMAGPPADRLLGQSIGRFRIDGVLGRGGMGVVYRATDPELERTVALKFISTAMAANAAARERFEREARAAARLDNPNVGAVYEIGEHQGRPWIAMAYYSGETLAQRIERGPLTADEAHEIVMSLIDALDDAHRAGIVHRDVKPANIMLTTEGKVKLLDFGLAKLETAPAMTRSNQTLGTLAYMAPEQLNAEPVDARADLWALAVVWAEMLTGQNPFRGGKGLGVITGILDDEPSLDLVTEEIRPILTRCLEKDRKDRPESMAAVRDLLEATGMGAVPATPQSPEPRSSDPRSPAFEAPPPTEPRRASTLVLIGVLALGLIVALFIGLDRSPPDGETAEASPPEDSVASPKELRRVAVAPVRAEIDVPGADPEISKTGVRIALLRALTGLEGLRPLPPDQLEEQPGSVVAQAKTVGAGEVLTSDLRCQTAGCSLELALLRAGDGSVAWSEQTQFSWGDKELAALATAALVRRAFPELSVRDEAFRFEMSKEDFLELATLWHAYDKRSMPRLELLERLGELRRRAPGFVEIHLLEIDVARLLFVDTRDAKFLDHGSRIAEEARQLAPLDARPLYKNFALALEGQRIEEAEVVLTELERLRPGEAAVLQCQAQLAEKKGDVERAIEKMKAAVALHPTWRRLHTLANMEFRQGQSAEARDHAEQLLTLSPENYAGLRLLAEFELMTGELERAEELYKRLVSDRPEISDLMNLGLVQNLSRRYAEAEETYRRLLELGNHHPGTYLNLADILALQGKDAEAVMYYEETLERIAQDPAPGSWGSLLLKAQAMAHLGRAGEAVAAAQAALTQMPNSAQVAYEISLVYAILGERHSALLNAQRALDGSYNPMWFELEWFESLGPELRTLLERYRR